MKLRSLEVKESLQCWVLHPFHLKMNTINKKKTPKHWFKTRLLQIMNHQYVKVETFRQVTIDPEDNSSATMLH